MSIIHYLLRISHLQSGGLITNYSCTSRCRHCLYACSPKRSKEYITAKQARENFRIAKEFQCKSLHIGGGEPFLNPAGLMEVARMAGREGIVIEYIETNASWFNEGYKSLEILDELKNEGIHTLLISISPFHNEFIPFNKVKKLIEACYKKGIHVFPWMETFIGDQLQMDTEKTHKLEEYKQLFGDDYVYRIPSRYWIHYGGRAIDIFRNEFALKRVDELIRFSQPCSELADTSHFHIDLKGKYIPGLCSGFGLDADDLDNPLWMKKYRLVQMLYAEGIGALLDYAKTKYDFKTVREYMNKCQLCTAIREYLVGMNLAYEELYPVEFYAELE